MKETINKIKKLPSEWEMKFANHMSNKGLISKKKKKNSYCITENFHLGVPVVALWLMNLTRNNEVMGSIPGLTQWVKDPANCELWCRSQTWLGPQLAVAVM